MTDSAWFPDSPYGQVLLHPPLVGNITSYCPLYALDATCREVKKAREGFVYYRLNKEGTTRFMKERDFQTQMMKRIQDMKRARISASFKGARYYDAETFVTPERLEAIKDADDIVLYLRDSENYSEFTTNREWPNVTEITISRYPFNLTDICDTFGNLRRLLIRVAEQFSLTPLNFFPLLEYLEIDCARARPSSVSGQLRGSREYLTKLSHITLDHFPSSTANFVNLKSVRTLEMHAQAEFAIHSSTINKSFPNLQCVIQRPYRDFENFRVCENLREIHTAPNSVPSFPTEFNKLITKLVLIEWGSDCHLDNVSDRIVRLEALEELVFHCSPYSADFSFIGKLTNLKLLDVRRCRNLKDLAFIKDLPLLEVLKLRSLTKDFMDLLNDLKLQRVVVDSQPSAQVWEMSRTFLLTVESIEKEIVTFPNGFI